MTAETARRRAGWLLYAALQFLVLTTIAMTRYPGGSWWDVTTPHYGFTRNFLSDLGATRAFNGHSNYASCVLFAIAMLSIGAALVAFAPAWRAYAFARQRARAAGLASQACAIGSGLAFAGIGVTPWNLVLWLHNGLVLVAFGLLLGYVACMTLLFARNGASRAQLAGACAYLAIVAGYVGLVLGGPRLSTEHGHHVQVIGQKIIVYASMLHVIYLTTSVRRGSGRAASLDTSPDPPPR